MASSDSPFLIYDVPSLLHWYRAEGALPGGFPYTELACFLRDPWAEMLVQSANWRLERKAEPFELASCPPSDLGKLQASVYDGFVKEGRVDREDTQVVRLEDFDEHTRTFVIRPCKYSDGLRSNYAMDWQGRSLRSWMTAEYGPKLPPLSDARFSNALGLSAIVWRRSEAGEIVPYLPKRARNSAVFDGGYHCTASGESEWKPAASSFDQMFTADMSRELSEEVGLQRDDLDWIVPVALCREFLRGGKPQLFFAGFTSLEECELGVRRRRAIEQQIVRGRQEVLDDVLTMESESATRCTIECRANLYYARRAIEMAGRCEIA